MIEAALSNLADAPVDETVVVVGDDAQRLREVCEPYGFKVVENPDWARGMSTSVRAGLRSLGPEARAAVVVLADQPRVGAGAVERLVAAFEAGARVAVATYGGKSRNPVLFSREVWPRLMTELSGDEGARSFLRRHPELVTRVPCDGVGDPADVDTVDDLRRLEMLRGREHSYKIE
jgi:CTP:molybdopterin cytidylyltransferase MocA